MQLKTSIRFVVYFLLATLSLNSYSQEPPTVQVCGESLKGVEQLQWNSFSAASSVKSAIQEGRTGRLLDELQRELDTYGRNWPSFLFRPFSLMLEKVQSGRIGISRLSLSKTSDLPARLFAFKNTDHEVEIPWSEEQDSCQQYAEQWREFAALVKLAEQAKLKVQSLAFKRSAEATRHFERYYDSYLFEGYPQFPWEASINSLLLSKKNITGGPPRSQLVIFHPGAGLIGSVEPGSQNDIAGILSVEPIGFIRYSRDYKNWYGVSLLTTFPTDRGPGYGIAINYNNFKVGVSWHDDDSPQHDGVAVFIGFDLFQLFNEKITEYSSYRDRIEDLMNE